MRMAAVLLLVLALACEAFAYWGLKTQPGREAFDEMAGIVPLGASLLGALLTALAALAWWRSGRAGR